jgi:hypothetical protein
MKKFLILAILIIATFTVTAQTVMRSSSYIYEAAISASDAVSVTVATWESSVLFNKVDGLLWDSQIALSGEEVNNEAKIYLYGKVFTTDTYAKVDSATWKGTTTDTLVNFTQHTTKTYNRFFKWSVEYVAGTTTIEAIKLSLKK